MSYWQHVGTGAVRATRGQRPTGPGWVEISRAEYLWAKVASHRARFGGRR